MKLNWKPSFKIMAVAVSAACLVACGAVQHTTGNNNVGVNRAQKFSVSSAAVNQEALKEYSQVITDARSKRQLDVDANQLARVKRITGRLIAQTPSLRPDARSWPWEVHVIQSKEMNAWCMPEGKIVMYSGLIEKLKLTDDEIAAVMGHEMVHALREHVREQLSRSQTTNFVAGVLGAVGQAYGVSGAGDIASLGANIGFNLPFSRTHEQEADLLGMELAARAGFNPNAAVALWDKMLAANTSSPPQFLSDHPSPENRRAKLQANIPNVMPLYLAAQK